MSPLDILSLGNMLVEIMRPRPDMPLHQTGTFSGPWPSGDTLIYISQAARLGARCGFIGAVGTDDFGRCLRERLDADGIDFSHGRALAEYSTGVAFNAGFSDGGRRFLFHWRHAAAGQLAPDYVDVEYISQARWLHLSGCNLAICESARATCLKAMDCLAPEARLSFDANIRPEMLGAEEIRALCQPVIARADLLLPSAGEAALLSGTENDEDGCRLWAAQGKLVALKQGAAGCTLYYGQERLRVPSFTVAEVDATGAGDCFGAALGVALLEGMDLAQAGRFANAVGALSVTRLGPMEGAPTRARVEHFLAQQKAG